MSAKVERAFVNSSHIHVYMMCHMNMSIKKNAKEEEMTQMPISFITYLDDNHKSIRNIPYHLFLSY